MKKNSQVLSTITFPPLVFFCFLGVSSQERSKRQKVTIQLEFSFDSSKAQKSDAVKDTVDYAEVFYTMRETAVRAPWHLLEGLGDQIAAAILRKHPLIQQAKLSLSKQPYKVSGLHGVTFKMEKVRL